MKYKHAMERLRDLEDGKEIEWNDCGEWKKDSEPWLQSVDHMNSPNLIRTKETTTKLPFGPEDITSNMWFRLRSWVPPARRLVVAVYRHGITLGDDINTTILWDGLLKDYSYSTDAITWHPCEKPSTTQPKREPRRVFVNYYIGAEQIGVMHLSKEGAEAEATDEACESAVEFVEVIK